MAEIEKSAGILIKKPLVEVFTFVAEPGKFQLWQPFVIRAEITSKGEIGVGTTYRYTFQAMGNVIETSGVITEYQPFHRYAYQSTSGPFPIKGSFSFQEFDKFVEIIAFGEAEPGGYFSMAKTIIKVMLGRQLRITMQTLKEVLENSC